MENIAWATPGWILVIILSVTLAIFLVAAIILTIKLIRLTKDVRRVILTGQKIADNVEDVTGDAADMVRNAKKMTTVSGIVASVTEAYGEFKKGKKDGKK